ncbi:hypothetical protein M422DRAFT_27510 [Sphaerobolus stellatus SS14]|nr:hypothetical protein M422DRAFT_27510 [Sphaerobolus stellatus SS14]
MAFSISSAVTVAMWFEAMAFGVYLALAKACFFVLYRRRRQSKLVNRGYLWASGVFFLLITWTMTIDIVRLIVAFQGPTLKEVNDYLQAYSPMNLQKSCIYLGITLLSDAFMVYRTWIVWGKALHVVITPIIIVLLCANIGTGIATLLALGDLDPILGHSSAPKQQRLTISFFAAALAVNGTCTSLIALRIWRLQREMVSTSSSLLIIQSRDRLSRSIAIVLESGIIYSGILLLVLLTLSVSAYGVFIVFLDLTLPIVGIAFSLMILRASLGFRLDGTRDKPNSIFTISRNFQPAHPRTISESEDNHPASFEMSRTDKAGSSRSHRQTPARKDMNLHILQSEDVVQNSPNGNSLAERPLDC